MLKTLAIANYRSIREMVLPLGRLNLVTGANGTGKSNLYKGLRLLADTARGAVIASLAREGGFSSSRWAGQRVPVRGSRRHHDPVNLRLGFCAEDVGYTIDIGLPIPYGSMFDGDPTIKRETIFTAPVYRPGAVLIDRRNALARCRQDNREWLTLSSKMQPFESLITELSDPRRAPEATRIRDTVRSWRFYEHFRTDRNAPARQPVVATRTPILAPDGRDLAAALETIREIGNGPALAAAIDDAFPGATLRSESADGRLKVAFTQPGLHRDLSAAELSDGTLRFLLWAAALMTPRPPPLMVLNEPETSLHPDLLPALGRLIIRAAGNTQVWVVSHASRLVATLEEYKECNSIQLDKSMSQSVVGRWGRLEEPPWKWPTR